MSHFETGTVIFGSLVLLIGILEFLRPVNGGFVFGLVLGIFLLRFSYTLGHCYHKTKKVRTEKERINHNGFGQQFLITKWKQEECCKCHKKIEVLK